MSFVCNELADPNLATGLLPNASLLPAGLNVHGMKRSIIPVGKISADILSPNMLTSSLADDQWYPARLAASFIIHGRFLDVDATSHDRGRLFITTRGSLSCSLINPCVRYCMSCSTHHPCIRQHSYDFPTCITSSIACYENGWCHLARQREIVCHVVKPILAFDDILAL